MDFFKEIWEKRKEIGYSRNYVASELGISFNYYRKMEWGLVNVSNMNISDLDQICNFYDIPYAIGDTSGFDKELLIPTNTDFLSFLRYYGVQFRSLSRFARSVGLSNSIMYKWFDRSHPSIPRVCNADKVCKGLRCIYVFGAGLN